jgi:hypothetical protein
MNRRTIFTLTTMAMLGMAVTLPAGDVFAQQKQKVSYKIPAENTEYTQQLAIDVGDVPGHQVRVFEIHRTFPANAPMINGVKLKEMVTRGVSDYADYNGPTNSYSVYVLENGDKFFVRTLTLGQANAAGKRASTSVGTITAGTGALVGIQGMAQGSTVSDPKAGFNENQAEIEYWIGK